MAKRSWTPCRVCGGDHKNPMSSSICSTCGEAERNDRVTTEEENRASYESSAFGQFMILPEDVRWRMVFDLLEAAGEAA